MNKLEGGPIGKLKNSHRPKDRMKLASALSSYRFLLTSATVQVHHYKGFVAIATVRVAPMC